MKEVHGWKCDGCKTVYDHKEDCEKCEQAHDIIVGGITIREFEPHEKYPHMIYVKFGSGAIINYKMVDQFGLY